MNYNGIIVTQQGNQIMLTREELLLALTAGKEFETMNDNAEWCNLNKETIFMYLKQFPFIQIIPYIRIKQ